MSGPEGGFFHAVARFSAEVDQALTTARRAAREAKAESAGFRRRTEELAGQAKAGKLRGLRRAQVAPTTEEAREDATKFRTDNGLPVPELPAAEDLMARLPHREPAPAVVENEDFSQHLVLLDVDEQVPQETVPAEPEEDEPAAVTEPEGTRPSDPEDDFSQQRILMDATVESYRPDHMQAPPGSPPESENPR